MKLKYLLVMPRIANKIGVNYALPMGILYISAVMKQENFDVITINLNHTNENIHEILEKEILDNDIDVVLTGGLSAQYFALKNIVDAAKKIKPDITVIVGGGGCYGGAGYCHARPGAGRFWRDWRGGAYNCRVVQRSGERYPARSGTGNHL